MSLSRLVSGGQTGVDRAALDAALEMVGDTTSGADPAGGFGPEGTLAVGGWCPRGRRAEDGPIADRYPLVETPSEEYARRTEWNVRDSDGTLVFTRGPASGGTRLTIDVARRYARPCLIVDFAEEVPRARRVDRIVAWICEQGIETLNVAGPRESGAPGIYEEVRPVVAEVLRRAREDDGGPDE